MFKSNRPSHASLIFTELSKLGLKFDDEQDSIRHILTDNGRKL